MHVFAALAAALDARDLRRALSIVIDANCGFRPAGPDGAWTWDLWQDPLESRLDTVQSPVSGALARCLPAARASDGPARRAERIRMRARRVAGAAVYGRWAAVRARADSSA